MQGTTVVVAHPKPTKRVSIVDSIRRKTGLFPGSALSKSVASLRSAGSEEEETVLLKFSDQYRIEKPCVGKGSFGSVWRAFKGDSNVPFAVKEVRKEGLSVDDIEDLKKEIVVLRTLQHPNIIEYFGDFDEPHKFYIVMEFVTGGTLADLLKANDPLALSEDNICAYMMQIAEALSHCKDMGVVHRDIKPGNVIVSLDVEGRPLAKLIDFGFGAIVDLQVNDIQDKILDKWCGTLYYASPEIIMKNPYNYKTDFWSLGVMLYEVLAKGKRPFSFDKRDPQGKREMISRIAYAYYSFKPKKVWKNVSPAARDLVKRLLTLNPDERFGPEEMLMHPWIKGEELTGDGTSSLASSTLKKSEVIDNEATRKAIAKFRSVVAVQQAAERFADIMNAEPEEDEPAPIPTNRRFNLLALRRQKSRKVEPKKKKVQKKISEEPELRHAFPSGDGFDFLDLEVATDI